MTTTDLILSDDALTFARTTVGKPVFLVLRVATNELNVLVNVSTNRPDLFQLADDNRPLFNSSLALTPSTAGTYIHIRYLPTQVGHHEATLMLESAVGTRTVSLSGRCSRLSALHNSTNQALTRTAGPRRQANPAVSRLAAALGGGALLAGLIYAGITYRCTLMPSLCRETEAAGVIHPPVSADQPQETTTASTPLVVRPSAETDVPAMRKTITKVAEATPAARRTDSTVMPKSVIAGNSIGQASEKGRPVPRPATPKATPATPSIVVPARPIKAGAEAEESELERELNGHTN